jgi:hypothetical protein
MLFVWFGRKFRGKLEASKLFETHRKFLRHRGISFVSKCIENFPVERDLKGNQ